MRRCLFVAAATLLLAACGAPWVWKEPPSDASPPRADTAAADTAAATSRAGPAGLGPAGAEAPGGG